MGSIRYFKQIPFSGIERYLLYVLIALLVFCSAYFQLLIATFSETADLPIYVKWGEDVADRGILNAYFYSNEIDPIDYPPIIPGILGLIKNLENYFSVYVLPLEVNQTAYAIRVTWIFFSLCLGLLIFSRAHTNKTNRWVALGILCLWLFNPGIIMVTAYWGQADVCGGLAIFSAFYFLFNKKMNLSWAMTVIAIFTKPLTWPLAPVVLLLSIRNHRLRSLFFPLNTALLTLLLICAPLIENFHVIPFIKRILDNLWADPFVSLNAHNLWWVLVDQSADFVEVEKIFFPTGLSYEVTGIIFFFSFYFYCLYKIWHESDDQNIFYWLGMIGYGFFILSTHMHENHLYLFFPFFIIYLTKAPKLTVLFIIISFSYFYNMLHHSGNILDDLLHIAADQQHITNNSAIGLYKKIDFSQINAWLNITCFALLLFMQPGKKWKHVSER